MKCKTHKHTDHNIHNELLQIVALNHLHRIAAGYFVLEADEVTDATNNEQVIVCLRWVDAQLEPHKEFIGLHHVPDITAVASSNHCHGTTTVYMQVFNS